MGQDALVQILEAVVVAEELADRRPVRVEVEVVRQAVGGEIVERQLTCLDQLLARGSWPRSATSRIRSGGDFPDEALEDLMRLDQLAQRGDDPTAMMAVTEIGTLVRPLADVRGFAAQLV